MISKIRVVAALLICCIALSSILNGCNNKRVNPVNTNFNINVKADNYFYVDSAKGNDNNSGKQPDEAF